LQSSFFFELHFSMSTLSPFVFQTSVFSSQLRFLLLSFPVIVGRMLLVQILQHLLLRSFRFTSLIFLVSSFDLLFVHNIFSFILLLPFVPTSLFSSFISLLFCLQLNTYISFSFFFLFSITLLCHSSFSCVCFQVLIPMLRCLLLRKICLSSFSFHFLVLMLCRGFFKEKYVTFVKNQAFNKKT